MCSNEDPYEFFKEGQRIPFSIAICLPFHAGGWQFLQSGEDGSDDDQEGESDGSAFSPDEEDIVAHADSDGSDYSGDDMSASDDAGEEEDDDDVSEAYAEASPALISSAFCFDPLHFQSEDSEKPKKSKK